jgi:competence protein ComEA
MGWVVAAALAAGLCAGTAEAAQLGKPGSAEAGDKGDGRAGSRPAAKARKAAPAKGDAKVNINAATKAQLMTLDGIGAATARRIIEHREANGPFGKPDDLARVDGVGKAVVEKNAARITVR